jgi:hypothetical protein
MITKKSKNPSINAIAHKEEEQQHSKFLSLESQKLCCKKEQ